MASLKSLGWRNDRILINVLENIDCLITNKKKLMKQKIKLYFIAIIFNIIESLDFYRPTKLHY